MPNTVATIAYQLQPGRGIRRDWLNKTQAQLIQESNQQQQFWLVFGAQNATLLPAIFRLPSRDYPFLVTGAAVNLPVTSLKLYTTGRQLESFNTPVEAIAGGSDDGRQLFRWAQPVLLKPNEAWRLEITLADASGLALNTVIALRGVKLGDRKK